MSIAIACMSGSFKGVFVQGVLAEFETNGLRADAYASVSSSTLSAAFAASGGVSAIGMDLWTDSLDALELPSVSMSDVVLAGVRKLAPRLLAPLFSSEAPRFLIATSRVTTPEAAEATQGAGARRLGRKLLVDAARRDRTWPDRNLAPCLFDSRSAVPDTLLTPSNFEEVAYATTRMLHAWPTPAWVAGAAHIDGSYTCLCPAVELAAMGYRDVIAIATEPGPIPRSMFTDDVIPARVHGARIRIVQPDADLREIGVDFLTATRQGVEAGFELGRRKAREFLTTAY